MYTSQFIVHKMGFYSAVSFLPGWGYHQLESCAPMQDNIRSKLLHFLIDKL